MDALNIALGSVQLVLIAALGWQNRQLRRALDSELDDQLDDAARAYWTRRAAKTLAPMKEHAA